MIPRLKAVILAGGRSRRMGLDKSLLKYRGIPQLYRVASMLAEFDLEFFVSLRQNQRAPIGFRTLTDEIDYIGPAAGIISAYHRDPTCAWLVLAIDLPLINETQVSTLIQNRNPDKHATVFLNRNSQIEPLAAVWEPSGLRALGNSIARSQFSPRKTLESLDCQEIRPQDPMLLFNANTPEDADSARRLLDLA